MFPMKQKSRLVISHISCSRVNPLIIHKKVEDVENFSYVVSQFNVDKEDSAQLTDFLYLQQRVFRNLKAYPILMTDLYKKKELFYNSLFEAIYDIGSCVFGDIYVQRSIRKLDSDIIIENNNNEKLWVDYLLLICYLYHKYYYYYYYYYY